MKYKYSTAHCPDFQLDLIESLPYKPYCTDELGVTYIRQKKTAITKRYLQVNPPKVVNYLVFDIDREGAVLAWCESDLPAPFWTSKNPVNAHAHIAYRLKVPVCTSHVAHLAPMRYLAAIQSAMVERLKADKCFAGLLTKNPLHPYWQNTVWTEHEYSLDELADYLDLRGHPKKGPDTYGLGRNCELFDNTRKWAYKAIREFWQPEYKASWDSAVYDHVEALNGQFLAPLPVSEVKSIAKSISNWTFKHFTPGEFRKSQAKKGAKGGKIGGKVGSLKDKAKAGKASKGGGRPNKKALLPQVINMKEEGFTNRDIAVSLGLGSATISRWMRSLKNPILDPKQQSHIR